MTPLTNIPHTNSHGPPDNKTTVIMGAGLAGLSTGYVLSKSGRKVAVFEGSPTVGGLSKTIFHQGFRFDIGGHRFITKCKKLEQFVLEVLKGEFLEVPRKSKIFMMNKYFDYPLRPTNAAFGLGMATTCRILSDYCQERVRSALAPTEIVSLEDWVVNRFGKKMFELYFREYSEKVWGVDCKDISMEWVAQRIKGLSLWTALKNAFVKFSGKDLLTLSDRFFYPPHGIGQISDRLLEGIEEQNRVNTSTRVLQVNHENFRVKSIVAKNCEAVHHVGGANFVSSIPLTHLIDILNPAPPEDIRAAAAKLRYRDLVIVTVMLNRERVTDLTWMYLPEEKIPFGRIHEPKNWSPHMAPPGKTHIVAEFFCFAGDAIWNSSDESLTAMTVEHLARLGFIEEKDVIGSCVLRKPKAYPLFEVGYQAHYETIIDYLENFTNLHIIGRGGMFRYHNMDHAMESGIEVAETIIGAEGVNQ